MSAVLEHERVLQEARTAYRRRDWRAAHAGLSRLREAGVALGVDDLAALADSAWWTGRIAENLALTEEVYEAHVARGDVATAATYALDLGFSRMMRGEAAAGEGWVSRARRLLADSPPGPEHGFLRYVDIVTALDRGDTAAALDGARELGDLGSHFHSPTLTSLGLLTEGSVRIRQGQLDDGFGLLGEAMLAVLGAQVRPDWAGNVYCNTLHLCHQLADLRRLREWHRAAEEWCNGFSDAVMFQGICRLHKVQLLSVEGAWAEAGRELDRVCRDLAHLNVAVVAEAEYERGEIHRVRGDHRAARAAYRRAEELGREPEPGWSLLLLAEGRADQAWSSINACLARSSEDPFVRVRLLRAHVEIALATGSTGPAERSAAELRELADTYDSPGFVVWSRHAEGAVLLAQGRDTEALRLLQLACHGYQGHGDRYETARVQLLLGQALERTGDHDLAAAARQAATEGLHRLGAAHRAGAPAGGAPGGLTAREVEVLAHVARGASNRDVAAALTISEKTVGRHLANVFTKIGVSSRTAAAAWAHDHGLAAGFAPSGAARDT